MIIDKGVLIFEGVDIGFDEVFDCECGFMISDGGVVVIVKGDSIELMLF